MIEARDATTMGRDRSVLLKSYHDTGGVPYRYDWRTKNEPALWVADAVAGAVNEYIADAPATWYDRLVEAGVITVHYV